MQGSFIEHLIVLICYSKLCGNSNLNPLIRHIMPMPLQWTLLDYDEIANVMEMFNFKNAGQPCSLAQHTSSQNKPL